MSSLFLPQPIPGRINIIIDFFNEREVKSVLRAMVLRTRRNSAVTLEVGLSFQPSIWL